MATESELKRVHAIDQLEKAVLALRGWMDAKALYEIEGAALNVGSLVEERQRESKRRRRD